MERDGGRGAARDAQLVREIEVALSRELDGEARRELVRGFVKREFVGQGMIADLAIHEGRAREGRSSPTPTSC